MIKNLILLISLVVYQQAIVSQNSKTCNSPVEDPLLELNSITKCSIDEPINGVKNKGTKEISVKAPVRRRVVRDREVVRGIDNGSSRKIADIKEKASLVGSLNLKSEKILENVPFNFVEEIPLFKACESSPILEQQKCFKGQISNHIRKNFKYPETAYDNSVQGRVFAQFIIDTNGAVTDLRIRGPYKGELLEEEVKRIIMKLPKFKAGKHNGKTVKVKYGIPINFKIPGRKPSNVR